jgi:hypothetical protein
VSGCASNVDVRYPAPPGGSAPAGAVLIRFTEPMRSVSVSIDGVLIAEDAHTERVHVADIPTGRRKISIVAASGGRTATVDRSEVLEVAPDREVSILVAVPPRSLGRWIWSGLYFLGYAVLIATSDYWRN